MRTLKEARSEVIGEFHTPQQNQGQIVIRSWACSMDSADYVYERVEDQSYPMGHPQRVRVLAYTASRAEKAEVDADYWNREPGTDRLLGRVERFVLRSLIDDPDHE